MYKRQVPKARPSLISAAATVAYPEYMGRPDGREPMRAGVVSAPEGSTLMLEVTASQPLAFAATPQGKPLRVDGSKVIIPSILLGKDPQEIELTWTDQDGLDAAQTVKVRLEPVEDKQPSVYLRGGENDRHVLEDTSIELEVEAADDFGLRELGVEWQGEKSFYEEENPDGGAADPEKAGKTVPGLHGEKLSLIHI